MKYLYAMLMWPYKFLGKILLSPSLHVFTKLRHFITCKLGEIFKSFVLHQYWSLRVLRELPSVADPRT